MKKLINNVGDVLTQALRGFAANMFGLASGIATRLFARRFCWLGRAVAVVGASVGAGAEAGAVAAAVLGFVSFGGGGPAGGVGATADDGAGVPDISIGFCACI